MGTPETAYRKGKRTEHRYTLKQKPNFGKFPAYLLNPLQNTFGLSCRGFFNAFDILSQKALIHSYSFRKCLCIDNLIKVKETFKVVFKLYFINGISKSLIFKSKIEHFNNHTLKFRPAIPTGYKTSLFPLTQSSITQILFNDFKFNHRFVSVCFHCIYLFVVVISASFNIASNVPF